MALHADIKVKMKKQPRPQFWGFGWRRKSSHVQSFEDAAAWNPFEVRDRITFFPCRSSSIGLHACSVVPCSRTPEQDQLSKTKLHSSAQFLHMPAVEHSAPELKNRTSSQRQSYIVLHSFVLLLLHKQFKGARVLEETEISSISIILQLHEQLLVQLFAHDHS
jgi:hypothetical protein